MEVEPQPVFHTLLRSHETSRRQTYNSENLDNICSDNVTSVWNQSTRRAVYPSTVPRSGNEELMKLLSRADERRCLKWRRNNLFFIDSTSYTLPLSLSAHSPSHGPKTCVTVLKCPTHSAHIYPYALTHTALRSPSMGAGVCFNSISIRLDSSDANR